MNKINFAGFQDNPFIYYHYADAFILSSRWEGFPNVVLEALATGTTVVSTNCKTGTKEILDDYQGILVKTNNIEELSNGMIQALTYKNKSIERSLDFDVKNIVKQYEKVFLSTIKENNIYD